MLLTQKRLTQVGEKCVSNLALKQAVNKELGEGHPHVFPIVVGRPPKPGTPKALARSQKDAWWNAALAEVLDGAVLVMDSQFAGACNVRTQSHLPEWELRGAATAHAAGATAQVALTNYCWLFTTYSVLRSFTLSLHSVLSLPSFTLFSTFLYSVLLYSLLTTYCLLLTTDY
jgi:hypothetical protein